MDMDTLKTLLPSESEDSRYCILGLKGKQRSQSFHFAWREVEAQVHQLLEQKFEVYFGCSKFGLEQDKRTQVNVVSVQSFWLDLDVGEGETKFESQVAAIEALSDFCNTLSLPLPTVINSGNGVHCYWPLRDPITLDEWRPVAEKLKDLCVEHKFFADPSRTADGASVLRVPGTFNFKDSDNPKPVKLITTAEPVDFASLKSNIGEVTIAPSRSENREWRKADELYSLQKILRLTANGQGCAQIAHWIDFASECEEPVWRGVLSVVGNCESGLNLIHKISENHPGYHPKDTEDKLEGTLEYPHSCRFFYKNNPSLCEGCPHWAEGKGVYGGPLQLGVKIKRQDPEAPLENLKKRLEVQSEISFETPEVPLVSTETSEVDPVKLNGVDTEPLEFIYPELLLKDSEKLTQENQDIINHEPDLVDPTPPYPYFISSEGRVFMEVPGDDMEPVEVAPNSVFVLGDLEDGGTDEEFVRLKFYKDANRTKVKYVQLPTETLYQAQAVNKHLHKYGLVQYHTAEMPKYIKKCYSHYQNSQEKTEVIRHQMGWADPEHKTFVIGTREMDGSEVSRLSPAHKDSQRYANYMHSKGSYEEWKEIANLYAKPGFEPYAFTFGSAFGASLLSPSTEESGVCLSMVSTESGTGKTTVLRMINSVFGHPKELAGQGRDTFASKILKMGIFNSIACTLDEVTNINAEEASNLLYAISYGRDRDRSESQRNALRPNLTTWRTLTVTSSNTSLMETLLRYKKKADGENMRVLEFPILKEDGGLNDIDRDQAIEMFDHSLNRNYGHVGPVYISWLIRNLPKAVRLVGEIQKDLTAKYKVTGPERFWAVAIAANIAGLEIATKLKLIDYDVGRIYKWVTGPLLSRLREESISPAVDYMEALTSFILDCQDQIIVTESTVDGRNKDAAPPKWVPSDDQSVPKKYPRYRITHRWETDTNVVSVRSDAFLEHCNDGRYVLKEVLSKLKARGVYLESRKLLLTKGCPNIPKVHTHCHQFKLPREALPEEVLSRGETKS